MGGGGTTGGEGGQKETERFGGGWGGGVRERGKHNGTKEKRTLGLFVCTAAGIKKSMIIRQYVKLVS